MVLKLDNTVFCTRQKNFKHQILIYITLSLLAILSHLQTVSSQQQQQQPCFYQGGYCQGYCYVSCLSSAQQLSPEIQSCIYNFSSLQISMLQNQQISINFLVEESQSSRCMLNNIKINGNVSTQVSVQQLLVLNGTLQQYTTSTSYYQFFAYTFYISVANVNNFTLNGLYFENLYNIQNDIIIILNCRNITIQNCNFNNLNFYSAENSIGYQIINITQTDSQSSILDSVVIQENSFNMNSFYDIGSIFFINNIYQNLLLIQNNQFSSNQQKYTSVIYILNIQSAMLVIQANNFYNNILYQNNGAALTLYKPNSQINLYNNTYSFNQVLSGMGGSLYIYQSKSQISIHNEEHQSNQAYAPQNYDSNIQGKGGSTYILESQGPIIFYNCSYYKNQAVFGGGAIFLDTTYSVIQIIQVNFLSNQAQNAGVLQAHSTIGQIEVQNCYFFNNFALYMGGALFFDFISSQISFIQTNFSSNTAEYYGGAGSFVGLYSKILFQSCTFFNNSAIVQGGAIDVNTNIDIMEFQGTNFSLNKAQNGGSIYIFSSSGPTIFFFGTYFNNSAQFGGFLYIDKSVSNFLFQSTNFTSNLAETGGSIYAQNSQIFINLQSGYYQNNVANLYGGVIHLFNQQGDIIFEQNYFENNTAAYGGAIAIQQIQNVAYFEQNIYISNNARIGGGAIYVQQSSGAITFLQEYYQFNQAEQVGGSLYITDFFADLDFMDNNFISNQATNGGCIFLEYIFQNIYVSNNNFVNNQVNTNGGGIYLQNCNNQPLLYINLFKNNSAQGQGGGIFMLNVQQTIILNQCDFVDNSAIQSGGAVTILQGLAIQIQQNTFFQNSALIGGAINIQQTQQNTFISQCLFQRNIANQYGGALTLAAQSNSQASLHVSMSQFQENTAINQGGADIYILLLGNILLLSNQFKDSKSQQGGSIYAYEAISLTQTNSTFINCVSETRGSAIYANNLSIVSMSEVQFVNCSANQGTVYLIKIQTIVVTNIELYQNIALDFAAGLYINSASIVQLQNASAYLNYAQVDGGVFMLQNIYYLTIDGLQCYQNQAQQGNGGGLYIATTQSTNFMGFILFDSNNAGLQGGGIYLNNPVNNVQINTQIILNNNNAYQGGGMAITSLSNQTTMIIIILNQFIFQSNYAFYQGGGFYMQGQIDSQDIIQYQPFQNNNIQLNILKQQSRFQIVLNNSQFNDNSALFGGAVYILQNQLAIIQNCQFENNLASYQSTSSLSQTTLTPAENAGGGAVYLFNVQYSWTSNSSFYQNTAQKGGAFYQTQTDINSQITQQIYILNSTLSLNTAAQLGGAINLEYFQQIIEINGCLFIQNKAMIAGSLMLSLQNIQLLDKQTRILQDQVTSLVSIAQNNFSKNVATNQAQYAQDIRIIPEMQIMSNQLDSIQSQLLSSNYFLSQTENSVSLSCQPGEEQDLTTNQCQPCAVGQYSQGGYAAQCVACPSYSKCAGNYQLLQVDQGYWRANQSSLAIIQCIHTPNQCQGGQYCEAGYTGILCEECKYDQGYARGSSPFTCAKCDSVAYIWIIAFFSVIFTGCMILVIVKGNIDYRNEQLQNLVLHRLCKYLIRVKDNTPALTRILIGHAQVLTIIFSIDIKYPKYLVSFFSVFGQYTQVTSRNLVCAFGTINGVHPAYMKVFYDHLVSFATFLFLILILSILHWTKFLGFKENFKSFTLNLLIFLLPGMINQLIPLLSQRSVDQINGETFTVLELGIVWDSAEFQYSYKLILPLLVFWLAVFSGVVYVIFSQGKNFFQKRKENFINQASDISNFNIKDNYPLSQKTLFTYSYGNLFIGYTQESYYWEAVMMTVKLALIIIQYVFAQNQIVVTSFYLLILVSVMTQQFQTSPYENYLVKKLSNQCLIVQTVSIILLQVIYIDQNNTWLSYFILVLMIVVNYSMMLILVQNFLKESYYYYLPFFQNFFQNSTTINQYIQSYSCLQNNCFYQKLLKTSHRDRIVNYGWNIVLNAFKNMIRFTRQGEQQQQQQLISKHQGSQIGINQKNNIFVDTNKVNSLFVVTNLKKEVLVKTLFDDWKKNQQSSYQYKVYERWKDATGQKIIDQIIDQELEIENLDANPNQLLGDLDNIQKKPKKSQDQLKSEREEIQIQQVSINFVSDTQQESQLSEQYENIEIQQRQIDQDQSAQIQLIRHVQSNRSHEIPEDQDLHHSVRNPYRTEST